LLLRCTIISGSKPAAACGHSRSARETGNQFEILGPKAVEHRLCLGGGLAVNKQLVDLHQLEKSLGIRCERALSKQMHRLAGSMLRG